MKVFKDLKFEPRETGGVGASLTLDNGIIVSVIASIGSYSTPREDLLSPDGYSSFEVALLDVDGEWMTGQILPGCNDDVIGWQSREQINSIMLIAQIR
jgi:hypothetical protein